MPDGFCPRCGTGLRDGAFFCPRCGMALAGASPVERVMPASPHRDRLLRRPAGVLAVVGVVLAVVLVYFFGFYIPEHNVVTMQGGSWIVNGGSSWLGVNVGCSNCGQKPVPGAMFTIDVNVGVASQSCGYFGCNGYIVESFSVNSPYVLDQVSPANLPYTESAGSFNTWGLTITAPGSAGHYPLGGVVAVTYE
jgi:hypothetical protein